MERTRKIVVHSIIARFFAVFVAILIFSCDRDQCKPPFSAGGRGLLGVLDEGPIEANKAFGITVGIDASSVANLKDVDIVLALPPELEIETIVQPKDGPKVVQTGNVVRWRTDFKPSLINSIIGLPASTEYTLWLKSRTDWKEWSHPVKIDVSLNFSSSRECPNYPGGIYSKTITWSHEGYKDPDWQEHPNGYRGIWK